MGRQGLLDNSVLKPLPPAGLALLDDAVDHIRTVADLTVAGGAFCQQLAGDKVGQHHGNRGGADVDGTAYNLCILWAADLHAAEGIACQLALDADRPLEFPQGRRQLHHHTEGHLHLLDAEGLLNGPGQPFNVWHGVFQRRLRHGDHHAAEEVGEMDAAGPEAGFGAFKDSNLLGTAEVGGFHSGLVSAGNHHRFYNTTKRL